MSLATYNKKRNFKSTSEPRGKLAKEDELRFVVQRHHATNIHYDFRLEMHGVLLSWAVPKGPSLNGADRRLAMHVEDHPVSYINFEGTIPKGNYGAGTVEVWDHGRYIPLNEDGEPISEKLAYAMYKKGSLKVELKGRKLKGEFALVNMKKDDGKSWLLIKHKDKYAVTEQYNAEEFSKNKRKEELATIKTTAKKQVKKKPARKRTRTT
ncbi:DNA polymerase ligase N-terminal domain-containing protein [Lacibacter sp. H375]|uniref:DNA polymerase ligase N-terminal domain-containing protein n=1 Tax=Lacibacter sp. H375 TaxID=3133424 RepID=UPI0030C4763C